MLELSVWEKDLKAVPDDSLDAAFELAWESWDGSYQFCAFDVAQAYGAHAKAEQERELSKVELWKLSNHGAVWCAACEDTGWQPRWRYNSASSKWHGGVERCGCENVRPDLRGVIAAAPDWLLGRDGSWALVTDVSRYGAPHVGWPFPLRPVLAEELLEEAS